MKLTWEPFTLKLNQSFRIAHGVSDERQTVFLNLDGGMVKQSLFHIMGKRCIMLINS